MGASVFFVSAGTAEQVESAMLVAVATAYSVPESFVSVTVTEYQHRRLMTARDLTSSATHWQVDYLIVADENTADQIYNVAVELSGNAANGTFHDTFDVILTNALSTLNLAVNGSVQVTHSAPVKLEITPTGTTVIATETTATTSFTSAPATATPSTRDSIDLTIVGITCGVFILKVLALNVACVYMRRRHRRQAQELDDMPEYDLEASSAYSITSMTSMPEYDPSDNPLGPDGPVDPVRRVSAVKLPDFPVDPAPSTSLFLSAAAPREERDCDVSI